MKIFLNDLTFNILRFNETSDVKFLDLINHYCSTGPASFDFIWESSSINYDDDERIIDYQTVFLAFSSPIFPGSKKNYTPKWFSCIVFFVLYCGL